MKTVIYIVRITKKIKASYVHYVTVIKKCRKSSIYDSNLTLLKEKISHQNKENSIKIETLE